MKILSVAAAAAVLFGATSFLRPLPATPAAPLAAPAGYRVDGVHSSVIFRVKHMGLASFYGRFNELSGEFTYDPADASKLSIDVQIKADSIDTNSSRRDGHLKGPDFFNAKEFPLITFKSTRAAKEEGRYKVTGDLTLHGVTRPVEVTLEHTGSGEFRGSKKEGFEVAFTIQRSEFGMKYMLEGLSDEVRVMAGIEGIRK